MKVLHLFPLPEPTGQKASKKKPADVVVNRVNRVIAKRRHYLHKQLDKKLFKLDSDKREIISLVYKSFMEIPAGRGGQRYYIGQFIKMGYNVQFELPV